MQSDSIEKSEKVWKPKSKEEYSVEEKIAFFDSTYDSALQVLHDQEQNGRFDEIDEPHWAFERMMNLLGPGLWNYFNSLGNDFD